MDTVDGMSADLSGKCPVSGNALRHRAVVRDSPRKRRTKRPNSPRPNKLQIESWRPADVPSDAMMEAAGAIIGTIELQVGQIFDAHDPRENSGLYHLANQLHVRTKQFDHSCTALVPVGVRYDARKLQETERNLRAVPLIFTIAHVGPVKYLGGKVTVRVITKDVWTSSPGVSFGRSGGTNSSGFDLSDSNLLGLRKITGDHPVRATSSARSNGITYGDPNLFGSRWTLASGYVDASDGTQRSFALVTTLLFVRYALDGYAEMHQIRPHRFPVQLGRLSIKFQRNENYYELSGGWSPGLIDGWTRRIYGGACAMTRTCLPQVPKFPVRRRRCCRRIVRCPTLLSLSKSCRMIFARWAIRTRLGEPRIHTFLVRAYTPRLDTRDGIGVQSKRYAVHDERRERVPVGRSPRSFHSVSTVNSRFEGGAFQQFVCGRHGHLTHGAGGRIICCSRSERNHDLRARSDSQLLLSAATRGFAAIRLATNRAPRGACSPWSNVFTPIGTRSGSRVPAPRSSAMWGAPGAAASPATAIRAC